MKNNKAEQKLREQAPQILFFFVLGAVFGSGGGFSPPGSLAFFHRTLFFRP